MFTQIITHTPVWVWILLVALIALGISQTRDRDVSLKRITILPLAMIAFSASNILQNASSHPSLIQAWLAACMIATFAVMQIKLNEKTHFHANTGKLTVAGSWVPMVLILTIFIGKYAVAIYSAMSPDTVQNTGFAISTSMFFGALSGIFLGRAARLWRFAAAAKLPAIAQAI